MKKKITVTLSYIEEYDEEYLKDYEIKTFDDVVDSDYDNVGRPLNDMEDVGWKIIRKKIETIE